MKTFASIVAGVTLTAGKTTTIDMDNNNLGHRLGKRPRPSHFMSKNNHLPTITYDETEAIILDDFDDSEQFPSTTDESERPPFKVLSVSGVTIHIMFTEGSYEFVEFPPDMNELEKMAIEYEFAANFPHLKCTTGKAYARDP